MTLKKTKEQALEIIDFEDTENQISNYSEKSNQLKILFLIDRKISEISEHLKYFHENLKNAEDDENEILKWKYAVIVMDRFFFVLTSAYSIIAFVSIILPNSGFYFFD